MMDLTNEKLIIVLVQLNFGLHYVRGLVCHRKKDLLATMTYSVHVRQYDFMHQKWQRHLLPLVR